MSHLKLKALKTKRYNPVAKKMGYSARVITNGTATFDDICALAGKGSTLDPIEIEACSKAFCRDAAAQLKQGYIVDLGPLGKLYPSCTSGWVEKEEDLLLSSVHPTLYYKPAIEVDSAIKSASLVWGKASDDDENIAPEGGTDSGTTGEGGSNTNGSNGNDNPGGDNSGGPGQDE